jgi:hypothetical protein
LTSLPPASGAAAPVSPPTNAPMDREFIERNQVVERYLAGKLPPKGITDFERFVRENPQLIDELGLAERVHAGLRLLEASGAPEPWAEKPKQFWEKLPFVAGIAAAAAILLVAMLILLAKVSSQSDQIAALEREVAEQPLQPTQSARTVIVKPAGYAPRSSMLRVRPGEMTELKIELTQTKYTLFRVKVDRIDQGRVAVLENMLKDSNGHLRLQLNPSAVGPGDYMLTIEGLNMRREALAVAWVRMSVER